MQGNEEFKRRFRHIPEIIMNQGQVDVADEEIAEDYVEHIPMPPQFPTNRQGFKDFVLMLRTAFPDLHYDVDHMTTNDLIGENQKVVHRIVAHGTHTGPWGAIPATGKKMTWTEIHIGLYVEGKLVEHWGNIDSLSILQQMGAIPGWFERPPLPDRPAIEIRKTTTYKQNAVIVQRFISEIWNQGKLDVTDELIHPLSIDPSTPQFPMGPQGVKLAVMLFRNAFPDLYMFIEDVIAEEDVVAIRFMMAGTHQGIFMDLPPTGKSVEVEGCSIFHFANGQIVDRWQEFDMLGLFAQLGLAGNLPTNDDEIKETSEMSKFDERRALIQRMYDETNAGNAEILLELLAPNFTSYGGAGFQDLHGAQAFLDLWKTFTAAFPDLQFQVQKIVVSDDDLAAVRGIQTGTHKGNFLGMVPATGKRVEWTGTAIFRFDANNKIIERWQDLDNLSLFQQLGVIPAFGTAGG